MNPSDLIAALAAKQYLTENQAADTINLIFNVELNGMREASREGANVDQSDIA